MKHRWTALSRRQLVQGAGLATLGLLAGCGRLPWDAQQPAIPLIGFLSSRSPGESASVEAAFRQGLEETGYVDGQQVHIALRWADGQIDRLPGLATDLVDQRVAVIVAVGGAVSALAAKAATETIPIVFVNGSDPVRSQLVASVNRPGRNITGASLFTGTLQAKRLELLHEVVPKAAVIAVLSNPTGASAEAETRSRDLQAAATTLGLQIFVVDAGSEHDFETAFATLVRDGAGALLVEADAFFNSRRDQLIALAARYAVPAIWESREHVLAGGLVTYGASFTDTYRQAGIYTGRILKGSRPADLPVVFPSKFDLVINLKTAQSLGLTIPERVLLQTTEVIQ